MTQDLTMDHGPLTEQIIEAFDTIRFSFRLARAMCWTGRAT
jgi:hypothetical protein